MVIIQICRVDIPAPTRKKENLTKETRFSETNKKYGKLFIEELPFLKLLNYRRMIMINQLTNQLLLRKLFIEELPLLKLLNYRRMIIINQLANQPLSRKLFLEELPLLKLLNYCRMIIINQLTN